MDLQAVVGQLHVVEGAAQNDTTVPGLLAQPAPGKVARGREHDFLFVHLTLTGPVQETAGLSHNLLDNISRLFYTTSGSVTSALRQAINDTNRLLLKGNLSGKGPAREGAITCAVMRGAELYVLQVGESLAFVGHNFGIERLPARPPERLTPLGRSAGLDFRYFHQHLQPGDMLLLADPRMAHLPSHALTPALVDTEVELGLAELKELLGADSARLLLIEFTDDAPFDGHVVAQPVVEDGRIRLGKKKEPARAAAAAATTAEVATRSERAGDPAPEPTAVVPDFPSTAEVADSLGYTTRRLAAGSAMGLSRVTGLLADVLGGLRPPPEEETAEESTHWAVPALLAIVIPIIVAVIVSSVYVQRGRVRRVAELKQEMTQTLVTAGDVDETTARDYYNSVLALADEAETLRPGDDAVERMRTEALVSLDRLDEVTPLSARAFYSFGEGSDLTAVALREGFEGGLYTLDAANNVVYSHATDESYLNPLTEAPETIAAGQQVVGSHVIGQLVDIMWRPSGLNVGRNGIAMLDAGGALISYYPNFTDMRAPPLGLSSEWQAPAAITQFSERLYVLDPPAATIWKYFPEGDGFTVNEGERTLLLDAAADLTNAVDFDIYSEDGSVVIAYGNGRIGYYDSRSGRLLWDENTLLQNGLTTPLVAPSAVKLVGRGLNASIFLLDGGNGRIVQISRGGTVLAQYRAVNAEGQDVFAGGSDLAVAETPLRIFVTVGNTLYVATQE